MVPMPSREDYGGACPQCGAPVLQKDEGPMVDAGFQFDACVWCGFAYGEVNGDPIAPDEVWEALFAHTGVTSRDALIAAHHLTRDSGDSNIPATVFDYR